MKSPPAILFLHLLLFLIVFELQFSHLFIAAHTQNDKSTPNGMGMTTTTTSLPPALLVKESEERAETERWKTPLQFSPIWLDESTKTPEIVQQISAEDDGTEAVVVENKYSNNNEEDEREFQPQEFASEDQVVHLEDQMVDETDEDIEEDDHIEDDDVTIHESVASEENLTSDLQTEIKDIPPEQVDVEVKDWNEPFQPLASTNENAIDSANAVSAPWYDVMAMGLPPSVAYNWQFLMDLSAKLRTAPRSRSTQASTTDSSPSDSGEYNTRLKYLLTRVQDVQSTQSSPVKLDTMKQQHLLKTKLSSYNHNSDDDILMWAWRRAVPL